MARIIYSQNPETASVVDLGEDPATMALVIMGERTKQALINLVNERRRILRERVPDHVPVVGDVESVEEALLDVLGGIGAAGGSSWFHRNFGPETSPLEASTPQETGEAARTLSTKAERSHGRR